MTGLFVMGYTSLVESSAVGATSSTLAAAVKGRLHLEVIRETSRKTLAISCMFMWLILAALAFGAIFDGLGAVQAPSRTSVHHRLGPDALDDHHA